MYDYDCGPCRDARRRELQESLDKRESSGSFDGFFRSEPKGECDRHFTYHSDCLGCRVEHDHLEDWKSARSRHRERVHERRRQEERDRRLSEERDAREEEDRGSARNQARESWRPTEETPDSDPAAGSPSGDWGWLPLLLGLAVACFILWIIFALASAAGSPMSTWRQLTFDAADPNSPALLGLTLGSAVLLLACGLGLGARWRYWLLQALQPRLLSLASLGRWLAVVALLGSGFAGLYALLQDRSRLDASPGSWAVDVLVGLLLILPILMWLAGRLVTALSEGPETPSWDELETLPRSIARQLARKGLVPSRVSCGAVAPPTWTPPSLGIGGRGAWLGSGWMIGDDCFVTFTFSKPGTADQGGPRSPRRGWKVEGSRDDFPEPAWKGTRTVALDEEWGRAQINADPRWVVNPIDTVPVAAWAKVAALPGAAGITYRIALIAHGSRIGYRFSAFAESDTHVVAVAAERTLTLGRKTVDDPHQVIKRLLTVPWTVTVSRGRLGEAPDV